MKSKEEYIRFVHQKIDEWDSKIDMLRDKIDKVEEESRMELQGQIELLTQKRDDILMKAKDMQQAGTDAFGDIKAGVDLAGDIIQTTLDSAFSRFIK